MKCVVTGGAGFIGSNLVDRLIKEGWQVRVVDNESSTDNEEFHWNNSAENHKVDICDYEKLLPIFEGATVIFHLAAESRIQASIKNPSRAVKTNIQGTLNVLEAARHHGVSRVIYSGTSSAYGLKNAPPLNEDMDKDCLNPYSLTKTCGEELCLLYHALYGLDTVAFRYFNVYGPRQPIKGSYAPVTGVFLRQKKNNKPLTIVGNGEQRRDFVHVEDVVRANLDAANLQNKKCVGQVINVGSGKNYSIIEIAEMISDRKTFLNARLGEAKETLADITKFEEIFCWKPEDRLKNFIGRNS